MRRSDDAPRHQVPVRQEQELGQRGGRLPHEPDLLRERLDVITQERHESDGCGTSFRQPNVLCTERCPANSSSSTYRYRLHIDSLPETSASQHVLLLQHVQFMRRVNLTASSDFGVVS